jgi:5-formyltetrahydrofolate cyclo-ligase
LRGTLFQTCSNPMTNAQLRRQIRQQRRYLSSSCQRRHSMAVLKQIRQSGLLRRYQRFAIYLDADGELATSNIVRHLLRHNKTVLLPALYPFAHNRLWFLPYDEQTTMKKNRFNISEPADPHSRFPLNAIDVIFMPLVAFDEHGNRLGMGGGFYDRTLSTLKNKGHMKKPLLIGLAHNLQKVNQLQTNSWDITLDGVITELHFYRFSSHIKQHI